MSHVLNYHTSSAAAPRRVKSRYSGFRWAVAGCAAFWVAVGVGVAHAIGG